MTTLQSWRTVRRIAIVGLVGAAVWLGGANTGPAQEKGPEKAPQPKKDEQPEKDGKLADQKPALPNMVRSGYTRPGYPEDPLNKDGTVRPLAWSPDFKGKLIGGTVYFVVLERTGADGDFWGTGIRDFDRRFVEGKNFQGSYSPTLDTKARYLYLYMVVNDRGLDPEPIRPAADVEITAQPVAASALRLLVDPRYITSWGHFRGLGLTAVARDRNLKGDIRGAAEGNPAEPIRFAFSANPSILAELPEKRYMSKAPASPLTK